MLIRSSPTKETEENNMSEKRQVPSLMLQKHALPAILASAEPPNHASSGHTSCLELAVKNCSWADRSWKVVSS